MRCNTLALLRPTPYALIDRLNLFALLPKELQPSVIPQLRQRAGFATLPRRRDEERPVLPRPDPAALAAIRAVDWSPEAVFETLPPISFEINSRL